MEVNLVFIKKDGTTQSFKLPSAVTFIGRRQDCDLCIPLSVVSRRHCEIYSEFGKVSVRDLKSRNGIHLNGKPIQESQVKASDILDIGPVKFIFQIDGVPENFDEYLPAPSERAAKSEPVAADQDETQEANFEDIMGNLENGSAGQSQTMDIDDAFGNNFMGDDDFDLDSGLA
jgi:pSer/pThr/pTyr-binding forkhead associated (FHA) protein